ncbi:uncharacterized protein LOC141606855 [Silene latifolia]|uniref:uncharacterized protein LOC141606855 n=1 Tax=Silene latifolia TaxID=37657 RepID=UPI003D7739E4
MATAAVATAAGAAIILYIILIRRSAAENSNDVAGDSKSSRPVRRKISRRPAQAPATWFETMTTLSETLRFTYSETLGKWPIGDLAFGINYLLRRQGDLQVASVYAGSDCVQLKGPEIVAELKYYLRLLTFCILFSKKPFPVFLESAGYSEADVLLKQPKAGLLKPAFTIINDHGNKCVLLLIRGTHSIKDTLTAVTGAVVPFHHSVIHDGGISNLILGYAHCGMVAAARWIAKLSTPCLIKALSDHPHYNIKIVGHSLGGGTAALLTYILREQKEFFSSTCVTFAPAACMTWELAESGKHFITTIINGSDLVPTFSTASIDELRSEVTASSWLNDLRDQVERTRVLNVVYRSASAIGSRLPSIATSAKARVAVAGALLRPVSSGTQVVMKSAQNVAQAVVRRRPTLSSWSCMGARRRNVAQSVNLEEGMAEAPLITSSSSEALVTELSTVSTELNNDDYSGSSSDGLSHDNDSEEEEQLMAADKDITSSTLEAVTEGELWYQLEKELQKQNDSQAQEEEAAAVQEITEEVTVLVGAVERQQSMSASDIGENHHFYPPGRIMHMVFVRFTDTGSSGDDDMVEERLGIYETPRNLYSKIRLTKTMINDHYMPMYKRIIEQLISELENDELLICNTASQED